MPRPMPRAMPLSGVCRELLASQAAGARSQRCLASSWTHLAKTAAPRRPLPPLTAATRAAAARPLPSMQRRTYKTVEEAKSRHRSGAGGLFAITGAGLLWYFEHEKERMQRKRVAEATKGVGRPKVGGPFKLLDQNGNIVTDADLKGRYSLVYFGFSHCPDICPEELDKMAQMYDLVEAAQPGKLIPVFVTCDPARDTPEVLKEYLAEFHPKFIGLTGTYDEIKAMCKAYRVYFSTPSYVPPGQDYLVDHSIYFYLMDPEGDFVEALGRQHSPEQAAQVMLDHMKDYKPPK